MQGEAERLDVPGQGRTAGVIDLRRHQPGRHLDDVGVEAELVQRVRGFEAEQAAADHGAGRRRGRRLPDRLEVLDGAVDEAAGQVVAGHGRDEWRGTGGEHQVVVGQHLAVLEPDRPGVGVEAGDGGAQDEPDPRVVVLAAGKERKGVGADLEVRRERHPVVGGPPLLPDDHDVVGLGEAALDRGLDEAVADHAVADDDELLAEVRAHLCVPSRVREASRERTASAQPPQPVVAWVEDRTSSREVQARTRPAVDAGTRADLRVVGQRRRAGGPVAEEEGSRFRRPEHATAVVVLGEQPDPGQVADQGGRRRSRRRGRRACDATRARGW